MSKLFYTDPLAAAIMAREFGVKIYSGDLIANNIWTWRDAAAAASELIGNFEGEILGIHPDSYHVFEPQVGDMCEVHINSILIVHTAWRKYIPKTWDFKQIIQRNNKPFFTPQSED